MLGYKLKKNSKWAVPGAQLADIPEYRTRILTKSLTPSRIHWPNLSINDLSMAYCQTEITPVRKQWSYCSLALNHRYYQYSCIDLPSNLVLQWTKITKLFDKKNLFNKKDFVPAKNQYFTPELIKIMNERHSQNSFGVKGPGST